MTAVATAFPPTAATSRTKRRALSANCPSETRAPANDSDAEIPRKRHRDDFHLSGSKRKRSTSCSTRSSSSSKRHKKKKKKRKHRERRETPSPRVNPIFLWVKQEHTKIVEVLCEDYDRRNRITLTKTAGGWRAIPHSDRLSRQTSSNLVSQTKDSDTDSDDRLSDFDDVHPLDKVPMEEGNKSPHRTASEDECQVDHQDVQHDVKQDEGYECEEPEHPSYTHVVPKPSHRADIYEFHEDSEEEGPPSITEKTCGPIDDVCDSEKCCEMDSGISVTDENHNTDFQESIINSSSEDKEVLDNDDNLPENTLISDEHSVADKELEDFSEGIEDTEIDHAEEHSHDENLMEDQSHNVNLEEELSHNENLLDEISQNENLEEELSHNENLEEELSHNENLEEEISQNENLEEELSHNENLKEEISHNKNLEEEISHNQNLEEEISCNENLEEEVPHSENLVELQSHHENLKEEHVHHSNPAPCLDNNECSNLSEHLEDMYQLMNDEHDSDTKDKREEDVYDGFEQTCAQESRCESVDVHRNEHSDVDKELEELYQRMLAQVDDCKPVDSVFQEILRMSHSHDVPEVLAPSMPEENSEQLVSAPSENDSGPHLSVPSGNVSETSASVSCVNNDSPTTCLNVSEPSVTIMRIETPGMPSDQVCEDTSEPSVSIMRIKTPEVVPSDQVPEDTSEPSVSIMRIESNEHSSNENSSNPVHEGIDEPSVSITRLDEPDSPSDSPVNMSEVQNTNLSTAITVEKLQDENPERKSIVTLESYDCAVNKVCDSVIINPTEEHKAEELTPTINLSIDSVKVPLPPPIITDVRPILNTPRLENLKPALSLCSLEPEVKKAEPESFVNKVLSGSPINLVVEKTKPVKEEKVLFSHESQESANSSLSSLYRLPEGTTIHKSNSILSTDSHKLTTEDRKRYLDKILNISPPDEPVKNVAPQVEPLNLGKVKKEKEKVIPIIPNVQLKPIPLKPEVKIKTKPDDITLKTILSKPRAKESIKSKAEYAADLKAHSKLMELLSHEQKERKEKDPLGQLKELLSDPNILVPDPLLVPRSRLAALVAGPAKEIPRLMAQNHSYSRLDPDLLVLSISHLQSMLQNCGKESAPHSGVQYPPTAKTSCQMQVDPSLNHMLWLPYLGRLEAMSYGHPDFLSALNAVGQYPPQYTHQPAGPNYDYAGQQQQMFNVWQDMMQKPNLGTFSNAKSGGKYYDPYAAYFKQPSAKGKSNSSAKSHGGSSLSSTSSPYYREGCFPAQPRGSQVFTIPGSTTPSFAPPPLPKAEAKVTPAPRKESTEPRTPFHPASRKSETSQPKLKVKDHLVDPNVRPQLLKFGDSPHPLWHPLFSSHEAGKTYSSPWQWTTPVTVNGD